MNLKQHITILLHIMVHFLRDKLVYFLMKDSKELSQKFKKLKMKWLKEGLNNFVVLLLLVLIQNKKRIKYLIIIKKRKIF